MKYVYSYLKEYLKNYFHLGLYIFTAVFLTICIVINYQVGFEDNYIDAYAGENIRILWYFLFYGFAYYTLFIASILFFKKKELLRKPSFWILSLLGLLSLSIDASFFFDSSYYANTNYLLATYLQKIVSNFTGLITVFFPLLTVVVLAKWFGLRLETGLNNNNFKVKPYIFMYLVMILIVFAGALTEDFQDYYPVYKRAGGDMAGKYLGWSEWKTASVFEVSYAYSFFNVEFVFRGFFVVVLSAVIGPYAVLPMVSMYCFLHFGKPAGETISSIFGGYILGVLAYYTKNIWGGVFIHMGIALLMELFAFLL